MAALQIPAPILIPLATAFLLPLVERVSSKLRAPLCILAMALTLGALANLAGPVFFGGGVLVYWMGGWEPHDHIALGISLTVDSWGLLMAATIALVGLLSLVYSSVYMRRETGLGSYYVLVMSLLAALIGFCLTGDLFNQFVWLEILSVAAFALTGFYFKEKTSVEAAFKYLVTNSVAALFIMVALALLYMQTGALNLAEIADKFKPTTAGIVAVGLLVGGFATKAALVPWHFWLPDAYSASPAPVAALFSGALSKIGIYAIARTIFTLAPPASGPAGQTVLLGLAAITILMGGLQMLQQQSIQRILGYSSISQMGYIVLGLAAGTPLGIAAAALHAVHHALVEPALFFGAGSLSWRAGVRKLEDGRGLARRMPLTFGLMVLAGLGLSGMPLFSGFTSKTMLETAAFSVGAIWIAIVAVLGSIFTFAGIARLLWSVFLPLHLPPVGPAVEPPAQPSPHRRGTPGQPSLKPTNILEAPLLALLPMLVPVALSLAIGLSPTWVAKNLAWHAASSLAQPQVYVHSVLAYPPPPNSAAPQFQVPPAPFDLSHWLVPLIVFLVGSLLAFAVVRPQIFRDHPWLSPAREVARLAKAWHSGLVSDYVLWNAFSTTVIVAVLVIAALR